MTIVEALIQSKEGNKGIRRPIVKHKGSNRSGWLSRDYVLSLLLDYKGRNHLIFDSISLIVEEDLLANDWAINDNT